jgi:hypothetical protein
VRGAGPPADALPSAEPPVADEFLILDADSTQSYAINAVLGGQHLIVRGPPGTGKSQSIANLIGSLIARGKRVLFVAEKRAAIDAVLKRLHGNGLDELVLDLHGRVKSRKAFAQEISRALYSSRVAPRIDRSKEQRLLERRRTELNEYDAALHKPRTPWGVSVYQLQAELLRFGGASPYKTRLRGNTLDQLHGEHAEEVADDLARYAAIGGFNIAGSGSPWSAARVTTTEEATAAFELVDTISADRLPAVTVGLDAAAAESHFTRPTGVNETETLVLGWVGAVRIAESFEPTLYDEDLESISAVLGSRNNAISRWIAGLF